MNHADIQRPIATGVTSPREWRDLTQNQIEYILSEYDMFYQNDIFVTDVMEIIATVRQLLKEMNT
jgi:hypothetical protein